jgi:two-component SAPR family response regulator
MREYREALSLVRGEFLEEEPYEEWAIEARQEFKNRRQTYSRSLRRMAGARMKEVRRSNQTSPLMPRRVLLAASC